MKDFFLRLKHLGIVLVNQKQDQDIRISCCSASHIQGKQDMAVAPASEAQKLHNLASKSRNEDIFCDT